MVELRIHTITPLTVTFKHIGTGKIVRTPRRRFENNWPAIKFEPKYQYVTCYGETDLWLINNETKGLEHFPAELWITNQIHWAYLRTTPYTAVTVADLDEIFFLEEDVPLQYYRKARKAQVALDATREEPVAFWTYGQCLQSCCSSSSASTGER
jgi:hypothetical protein